MALDILKGRKCMVWTFMGNARMYTALKNYGDRLSQVGLFSFKVDATGTITESGVAISDMLTYINKYLHMSKQVYLSAESMNDQLNLIGVSFNAVMGKAFPKDTINESAHYGRQVVKEMFERRNKIAHQNDRDHASADRTEITLELVNTYKQQIVSIAEAIYDIAAEK